MIVPWPGITDDELDILTKAGVVGYRITWRLTKEIDQKMVARTTERGWSMHYLHRADEAQMDGWKPQILKTPGKFVLEHMGGVDPAPTFPWRGQFWGTSRLWGLMRGCAARWSGSARYWRRKLLLNTPEDCRTW